MPRSAATAWSSRRSTVTSATGWPPTIAPAGRSMSLSPASTPSGSTGPVQRLRRATSLEINLGKQHLHYMVQRHWHPGRLLAPGGSASWSCPRGHSRLEVRPSAPPRNSLIDLRQIELRPRKPARQDVIELRPARSAIVCSSRRPGRESPLRLNHMSQAHRRAARSTRHSISCRSRRGCR